MRYCSVLVLVYALVLPAAGCSFTVARDETLSVTASDPEAEIYVDGQPIGRGVGSVPVARDREHAVLVRHGERSGTATVGTRISSEGIFDIVGCATIAVPCLGLLAPGFWRLDPPNVAVSLPPER